MTNWWRRFAEQNDFESAGRSWRRTAMLALGLSRETLAEHNGGWDRRVVEHYGTDITVGPWARRLSDVTPVEPVTNGVMYNGNPVMHEDVRVVHNG